MSEKKDKILEAALALFAEEGYAATSTSKVAKRAGVSEGLIFRHFENKEGLLEAIVRQGVQQLHQPFAGVVLEIDPKKVLEKALAIPFEAVDRQKEFWRLQFALKWQDPKLYHQIPLEPVTDAITRAFRKLGYAEPELECQAFMFMIDGLVGSILRGQLPDPDGTRKFLVEKYKL